MCDIAGCHLGRPACDDEIDCTDDECFEGSETCSNTPNDSECDDGLYCNGIETCQVDNEGCQPGTPPICDDGVECTVDECNEDTDSCDFTADDTRCDNTLFCDGPETCDAIAGCLDGDAPDCNDEIECTVDSCDEENDTCSNEPIDAACIDGTFCNGLESCDPLVGCVPGLNPCDDSVDCTVDTCDEKNDSCEYTADDSRCDNDAFCDGPESCDPVNGCQKGDDPCDDKIDCTADVCNESIDECLHLPDDPPCDNGDFCDGAETCEVGVGCVGGSAPCDVDQLCRELDDQCVECLSDTDCDDADPCNGLESCGPDGVCQTVFDADCNQNKVEDVCDIDLGTSDDCDANDVPDDCQPDCDTDGIPDVCELTPLGTSNDCNENDVPDECDVESGSSPDCNMNGEPDECEIAAIHNCCDSAHGPGCDDPEIEACLCAIDPVCCDTNWDRVCVDEVEAQGCGTCDIVSDCNDNGIPDECETDCNENGLADECDLATGSSSDCNCNEVPDECEINASSVVDCAKATEACFEGPFHCTAECDLDANANGIPDCCDPDVEPIGCGDCCGMADLIDVVFADHRPIALRAFDQPRNCAIDARQPYNINDANAREGWDRMVMSFSCDPAAFGLAGSDFTVIAGTPGISNVVINGAASTATVMLDDKITPGEWTCIEHTPSGNHWCMGYLPADASGDGASTASDINSLINAINLVPGFERPIYATDMDRSGLTAAQDVLRLIDMLNGAGEFDQWITQSLPPCPTR